VGGLRLVDKWRRLGGTSIVTTIPGDCTAGVQAAINACGPGDTLYFPAGTYTVSAPAPGTYTILSLPFGIKIEGDGVGETVIKVANACPTYEWLLGPATNGTDLTDLEIHDLTFDHNIANNAIEVEPWSARTYTLGESCSSGGLYYECVVATSTNHVPPHADWFAVTQAVARGDTIHEWPEQTCGTYVGSNIYLHDFEVINASSTNNVVVNTYDSGFVTGTGCVIDHITCSGMGDDPNHIVHDASFFYVVMHDYSVSGCDLSCDTPRLPGAECAIEAHGSDYTIQDNNITNFPTGVNVCGIDIEADNCIVQRNNITGCLRGIEIYSDDYGLHIAGYGLDNLDVLNNDINVIIFGDGTDIGFASRRCGIQIYPGSNLDVNDLTISGNTVTVDAVETVSLGFENSNSTGIGGPVGAITLSNSLITDNTVTNFPNTGIRFNVNFDTVSITDNTLVNCGCSLNVGVTDQYRTPISIKSLTNLDTVDISDNVLIDNIATTRIPYFVHLLTATASTDLTLSGNSYSVVGNGVWVKTIFVYDDIAQPLITENITSFDPPDEHVVDSASVVIDGIYTWTVDGTGLIWSKCRTGDTLLTVYPDADPETTSFDGRAYNGTDGTWAEIIVGTGDSSSDTDANTGMVRIICTTTNNIYDRLYRSLFLFDTSGIPGGAVIDEASLSLYITVNYDDIGMTSSHKNLTLVSSAPSSDTGVSNSDWQTLGATRLAADIVNADIVLLEYNTFQLNALGLANIAQGVGAVSKFGVMYACDFDGTQPAWASAKTAYVYVNYADAGVYQPKLEVMYH